MRRVVTGHHHGKAVFLTDGPPTRIHRFEHTPGLQVAMAWGTEAATRVGADGDGADRTETMGFMPEPGATRLIVYTIPPASVRTAPGYDAALAKAEVERVLPEMSHGREKNDPSMHTTDTVDYVIVLSGQVHLELDDGQMSVLKQYDIVVQSGTRHAWRNKSDQPVVLAVVFTGAIRDSNSSSTCARSGARTAQ